MARPRRLASLRCLADTAHQQQPQLRKSPRKKVLKNVTTNELDGQKDPSLGGERAATSRISNCNTTKPKRTTRKAPRDQSNSSVGSSSSVLSTSIIMDGLEMADEIPGNSRRGLISPVRRGRGHSRGGGGRFSSLQTAESADSKINANYASPLRFDITARPTTFGRKRGGRRGGCLARRSRVGPVTVTMGDRAPSAVVDQNEREEKGGRAVRRQLWSRGRSSRSRRRGGGRRQQRVGGQNYAIGRDSRATELGKRTMHSSSESSSEDNESGDNRNTLSQSNPQAAEGEEPSLSSSASSSSAISDDEAEWPRGNSLVFLSSPIHQQSAQQRHQMPSFSPPSVPCSRRRRRKKESLTEQQRRPPKPLSGEFDDSNPYETCPVKCMDPYQRQMREAFIMYRFLGDYSPMLRSFMLRNLSYLRGPPPEENFHFPNAHHVFADGGEFSHVKTSNGLFSAVFDRHNLQNPAHHSAQFRLPLTNSRISNKIPTTLRPSFICNPFLFGQKKATVQCFLVSETNGRLSSMRNISATFEMKVGEWIRNIGIDLHELHILSGDKAKSEYLVVRVVFRFEDAEIGGRHLRKVPSRLSSGGGDGSSVDHQNQSQHFLRKNGPADACDVVMFGAKRIFSYEPGGELKVINDEASINLFSTDELHFETNCLKLGGTQLGRLIHDLKPPGGSASPFITVHLHGDSDDEEGEEEEAEEDEEECQKSDNAGGKKEHGPKLKKSKVAEGESGNASKEGLSLREALEVMDMADNGGRRMATGNANPTTAAVMRSELLRLPKVIGLKFWLHSPDVPRAVGLLSAAQLPPGSPPGQLRRRPLFRVAAANANASFSFCMEDRHQKVDNCWEALCSSSSSSKRSSSDSSASFSSALSPLVVFPPPSVSSCASSAPPSEVVPSFVCRRFPSTRCFFCMASLPVKNLWALQKHYTFCHPRFEFCYESSISVSSTECLPGFSIFQNTKYDTSNELLSVRSAVRPTWLVTKPLAKEMRRVDNFPIERYTAVGSSKQITAEEYIRMKGRFSFETPTRIDKLWLQQMSIRKLNDITDLHPAECAMMQMWNIFLLRIRITLFGRRMLYRTLRVFIKYHWRHIDNHHLRTHFLLHLTCLLNTGAIDEEERYDLYRRMDPGYDPCYDDQHIVGREISALRKERWPNTSTAARQQRHFTVKAIGRANGSRTLNRLAGKFRRIGGERMKLRHAQHNSAVVAGRVNGSLKKTVPCAAAFQQAPRRPSAPPLPTVSSAGGCAHFNTWLALRDHFPFASNKRIGLLWKFLQDYDFPAASGHASK